MTRLLIVGGTGLVGHLAIHHALKDERVSKVIALTRRPIAVSNKLQNVVVDFSNMPEQADWWSVDGVVSALGTTRSNVESQSAYRKIDFGYPLTVARRAQCHGATHFGLVSSLGANPHSPFTYTRTKGQLEFELKKLNFESLTVFRPSVLYGHRDAPRFDERITNTIFKLLTPILPLKLQISSSSAVADT